ncbi:MAG: hypothetical protein WAM09_00050 [Anaerolineales bacterium]
MRGGNGLPLTPFGAGGQKERSVIELIEMGRNVKARLLRHDHPFIRANRSARVGVNRQVLVSDQVKNTPCIAREKRSSSLT